MTITRRLAMIAGAAALVPVANAHAAQDARTTRRYTRKGGGRHNGTSWADAASAERLQGDLAGAFAGDTFLIGFDAGGDAIAWSDAPIMLRASGAAGAPVRIQAGLIDPAAPALRPLPAGKAFFRGAPNAKGGAPFRVTANYVDFGGFNLQGASADGFVKFSGASSNVRLYGLQAVDVGRVIETDRDAVIRNLMVENCSALRITRGFARFRSLSDSVLRNLTLDAGLVDGGGENVCQLIAIGAGRNVRFENIELRRARNIRPVYTQGDGIVCEAQTADFVIRNCRAASMGDGAFDLKTTNVTLEDCTARDCKFGARIWANGVLRRCTFSAPHREGANAGACLECKGRADLVDCHLQAGEGAAIFHVAARGGGVGEIHMRGGAITLDRGAALVQGDPGGVVELRDVTVNGALRNDRIVQR